MDKNDKIYIAGASGLIGSNLITKLKEQNYINIITSERRLYDLTIEEDVDRYFRKNKPDYVILAAAKVGGIKANNTYPAEFITENLQIQTNIITNCFNYKVKKLLFLGSSCIYPRNCLQPIKEEYLMTGSLEQTNSAYAMAKIAGIEMCKAYNKQYGTNYIAAMPCNIYGINDHFDLDNCHVLSALVKRMTDAKKENKPKVALFGTGVPKREFLFSDDIADGLIFLMNNYNATKDDCVINIGSGEDLTIHELALIIKQVTGYTGEIRYNVDMPDGTPRKLLDGLV